MVYFRDLDGIQEVKALKLQGGTKFLGTSANVAGITTVADSAAVFSFTNFSVNAAVIDSAETTAANIAKVLTQLIDVLAAQGICTVNK
jgi:hypothetical protein